MDCWKKFLLVLAMISAAGTAGAATNFYAHVNVTKTNVFLGEVFPVNVIVKAPVFPEAPDLDHLTEFNVKPLNAGTATSEADIYAFQYSFRAKKEGTLVIPPLRFTAGDVELFTEPVKIQAEKPQKTDRMTLKHTLSSTNCYVGEPVLLTTVWDSTYQLNAIKAVDFYFPVLNDKRFVVLDPYEPGKEQDTRTTGLPVQNTRVLATQKSYQTANHIQHQTLTFSKILIPKKAGKLVIPRSRLLCAIGREVPLGSKRSRRTAFQYPAYFDNTFFDQNLTGGGYDRVYTESEPITLEVKLLPTEGKPPLFSGMVGSFSLSVDAEPLNVHVGEPITLTIRVEAKRFMEAINFPPLRYQPLLINKFEIPTERSLPELSGNAKIYTQSIRPLSTAVSNIPPLQLVYFDPVSNAYITATSDPIPLTVSGAVPVTEYGSEAQVYHRRIQRLAGGIRQNYQNPDILKNQRPALFGWTHPFIVLLVLLTPPLVFGGFELASLFGKRKHYIRRTALAARAHRVYRRNTAPITRLQQKREIYTDLDRTLRAYLGDRLHKRAGALTFQDVKKELADAGVDSQTLEELKTLFETCEAYRFTTGYDDAADARKIVHDANRIIKAVERSLKK